MKKYLPAILILSSLIWLFASCSNVYRQGYRKDYSGHYSFNPVFSFDFDKALYRAEIKFGKQTYTSLAVVKKVPDSNSFRLAFFSEAGLRLFEMEFFSDGTAKTHYMSDFLNRKSIVKKLSSDFSFLFQSNESIKKYNIFTMTDDTSKFIFRVKNHKVTDNYFWSITNGPDRISERGCAFGRTTIRLEDYANNFPRQILFTHKMLNLMIRLNQINYSEWN